MRALALVLCLAATPAPGQSLSADMAGDWVGTGDQPGSGSWEVVLHLHADGAVVDYPSLGCAAWWRFTAIEARRVSAVEHLAAGFDRCADGLPLRIVDDRKGGLIVTWTEADGRPNAIASLARR